MPTEHLIPAAFIKATLTPPAFCIDLSQQEFYRFHEAQMYNHDFHYASILYRMQMKYSLCKNRK